MKILVFSIAILCVCIINAQPGYLGKKTDISIGTSAMMSLGESSFKSNSFGALDMPRITM